MFQYILWVSVSLAVISLLVMIILIVRRVILQQIENRKKEREAILKPMLFLCMDDIKKCDDIKAILQPGDKNLILEIVHQLMEALRGESQDNLVDILKEFGAVEKYINLLQNGNVHEKTVAAENLANFELDEVKLALTYAMNDTSARVRFAVAYSLELLGIAFDLNSFMEKFIADGAKRPRAMRDFLRRIAAKRTDELLLLTKHSDENIVVLSVDALAKSQNLTIISFVSDIATKHSSKEVRASAVRTLAALGHPSAEGAVMAALKDTSWEVRAQAAIATGRIGLVKAVALLADLLSDEQWWVRFRAAESLHVLGPDGVKYIEEASKLGGLAGDIAEYVLMEKSGV